MMTQTSSDKKDDRCRHHMRTPLDRKKLEKLRAGDSLDLSGIIYGARDAAHRRMLEAIRRGKRLPLDLKDAVIFYVGPSPAPPGKTSGSIGPTTAARMDGLTEPLLEQGISAMIGKGRRSDSLKELCMRYKAVYLVAIGGVAAYLSSRIRKIETVAYQDLGPEAIHRIQVDDLPLFVAYDIYGGDIFRDR